MEEVQQVAAQCAAKVAVIQTELGGLRAKISEPAEGCVWDSARQVLGLKAQVLTMSEVNTP